MAVSALATVTRGALPTGTLSVHDDAETLRSPPETGAVEPPSFSKLDGVFLSGNNTRDDHPPHLVVPEEVPPEAASLWERLCPAGVYEAREDGLVVTSPTAWTAAPPMSSAPAGPPAKAAPAPAGAGCSPRFRDRYSPLSPRAPPAGESSADTARSYKNSGARSAPVGHTIVSSSRRTGTGGTAQDPSAVRRPLPTILPPIDHTALAVVEAHFDPVLTEMFRRHEPGRIRRTPPPRSGASGQALVSAGVSLSRKPKARASYRTRRARTRRRRRSAVPAPCR